MELNSQFYKNQRKSIEMLKNYHQIRDYEPYILNQRPYKKITVDCSFSFDQHITKKKASQSDSIFQDAKVEQEYRIQTLFNSEHIIRNYGMKYFKSNKILILQQYFQSFFSQYSLSNLNFQKRIKIFTSIAKGVQQMSNLNICHRTICPAHISMCLRGSQQPVVKINCFQYAVELKNKKSEIQQVVDTNQFSSPQLRKYQKHGLATDIWSLGAILNYILYQTNQNIWIQQQKVKIEVPQGTPDWLLQLLKFMLHYKPSQRYGINTILQIIKVSLKCIDILGRCIPIGKGKLKLNKKQSKLSYQ